MLDKLTSKDFLPYLNQKFLIYFEGNPLETELIEVEDLSTGGIRTDTRQPFSLVFKCPKEAPSVQNTYTVEHDKLGKLDLFMVPIGMKEECLLFQSVFN